MESEHYKVDVKLKHEKASVSRVHLSSGHATPEHAHKHDYVVHPHAPAKLLKTTYRDGKVTHTEEIEHKPGEPYFVAASEDGTTFSLKNIGDSHMLCDKTLIPPRK